MSNEEQEQKRKEEPIIIKKKKGHGGHGHHGGAWKVAYADFVTAMMAFFIVMWILGQSEEVKEQVTAYFDDPGAFSFVTGKRAIPIDLNLKPSGKGESDGEGTGKKSDFYFVIPPEQTDTIANKAAQLLKQQAIEDSVKASQRIEKIGETLKQMFKKEIAEKPELKEILSSIKIKMTKEGLRIELIESKESLFFEVGSSRLSKQAVEILQQLAIEIGKLPNLVDIEGHTDSRQYGANAVYTNWELSADRANSARRLLETTGFWEGQISKVVGYADRSLQNPNNPFDLSNRRISILIRQISSNEFLQNQSATEENQDEQRN